MAYTGFAVYNYLDLYIHTFFNDQNDLSYIVSLIFVNSILLAQLSEKGC